MQFVGTGPCACPVGGMMVETFVNPARFAGTCCRASNWRSLGLIHGYAREPGGTARWRHHGQPKEIFVFELTESAVEALSQVETPAHLHGEPRGEPMAAPRSRSDIPGRTATPAIRDRRRLPGIASRPAQTAPPRRRSCAGLRRGTAPCGGPVPFACIHPIFPGTSTQARSAMVSLLVFEAFEKRNV